MLISEPTNVELCVSLDTQSSHTLKETTCDSEKQNVKQTIELSKPVQIYVSSKQVKRWYTT